LSKYIYRLQSSLKYNNITVYLFVAGIAGIHIVIIMVFGKINPDIKLMLADYNNNNIIKYSSVFLYSLASNKQVVFKIIGDCLERNSKLDHLQVRLQSFKSYYVIITYTIHKIQ